MRTSAELSLALSGLTSGKPYDIFCYDNAGTPTLEFLVWTNDTTRATALAYQDGVLVKSGAATRRYLGTFYTTSTTTTEDSATKRYLWNYYHRVMRFMRRGESTASWTYTTATYRQANGSTANQLDYVCGVAEDMVSARVWGYGQNSSASVESRCSIGVDSTSAPSGNADISSSYESGVYEIMAHRPSYVGIPGVGRHYLTWLEWSTASGTCTWYGSGPQSNISGEVMA